MGGRGEVVGGFGGGGSERRRVVGCGGWGWGKGWSCTVWKGVSKILQIIIWGAVASIPPILYFFKVTVPRDPFLFSKLYSTIVFSKK